MSQDNRTCSIPYQQRPVKVFAPLTRAMWAACEMKRHLATFGIHADINEDARDLAVLSVWVDLLVWTNGSRYWWWSGRFSTVRGYKVYSSGPVSDPISASRRVVARYAKLRAGHPLSDRLVELLTEVPEELEVPRISEWAMFAGHRPTIIEPI